jgi:uncharacterized protein YpiB (UPF0302 family)
VKDMNNPTENDKKSFFTWYMMRHQWKDSFQMEIANMLYRVFSKDIKFAEGVECEGTYLIMPTNHSDRKFVFKHGEVCIHEPYQAYRYFYQNKESLRDVTIYIELEVEDPAVVKSYEVVLEEAPNNTIKKETEQLIKRSLEQFELKQLQNQIDEALDARNIPRFLELSSLLNDMRARQAIEPEGEVI